MSDNDDTMVDAPPPLSSSYKSDFLSEVYAYLPETRDDIIKLASQTILRILHNPKFDLNTKKIEVESILLNSKLTTQQFQQFLTLSTQIPDDEDSFSTSEEDTNELDSGIDDDVELPPLNFIPLTKSQHVKSIPRVHPSEIHSNWLEEHLHNVVSSTKVEEVLELLVNSTQLESDLINLIGSQHLNLISLLVNNNQVIYWYTILAKANDSESRELISSRIAANGLSIEDVESHDQQVHVESMPDEIDIEYLGRPAAVPLSLKIDLPSESTKSTFANYEQYDITSTSTEGATASASASGTNTLGTNTTATTSTVPHESDLRPIKDLPEYTHEAFQNITTLNYIQSVCSSSLLTTNENILLSAPTGAGKTNIALMAILKCLNETGKRAVYIAPLKALAQELAQSFQTKLPNFKVAEITGDVSITKSDLLKLDVLVATPEKWDIITRKPLNYQFLKSVGLLVVDEIHLLHDESRGSVLESLIVRHKLVQDGDVRLIGLSATLPNYKDIAQFIGAPPHCTFFFDASYRPVPLTQSFIGITEKNVLKQQLVVQQILSEKITEFTNLKKQIIVFVQSRKGTLTTKNEILNNTHLNDTDIGTHHAGLSKELRHQTELKFKNGELKVLVSTSTLAWGVNLPASVVIIKDTQYYDAMSETWRQLSLLDTIQMLGRAGRPGFDVQGHGIIITTQKYLSYYASIATVSLPIESYLMNGILDAVNAEVVLGNITNTNQLEKWLRRTYWFMRMQKSPKMYGDVPLLNLAHSVLLKLSAFQSVQYSYPKVNADYKGELSSIFYLKPETTMMYTQNLASSLSFIELIKVFAMSTEFQHIRVKKNEAKELQRLQNLVPLPVRDNTSSKFAKISMLLQAFISSLKLTGLSLSADMVYIATSASRLFRAIYELSIIQNWARIAEMAHEMYMMVDKKLWAYGQSPLRQFQECPNVLISKLERSLLPWRRFNDLKSEELNDVLNLQSMKLANVAFNLLKQIPIFDLKVDVQPVSSMLLSIVVEFSCCFEWNEYNSMDDMFVLIVENMMGDLVFNTRFKFRNLVSNSVAFDICLHQNYDSNDYELPPMLYLKVISERWLHGVSSAVIDLRGIQLPSDSELATVLPEQEQSPTTDDEIDVEHESVYPLVNKALFPLLMNTYRNLFIGMPPCCDPCRSIELVCKQIQDVDNKDPGRISGKVIVITPQSKKWIDHQTKHFHNYNIQFINVIELESQTRLQGKLNNYMNGVQTVVLHDIHELGSQLGCYYELLVTRLLNSEFKCRLIALGNPVTSANSIGRWIECSKSDIANFVAVPGMTSPEIELNRWNGSLETALKQLEMDKNHVTVLVCMTKSQQRSAFCELTTKKDVHVTQLGTQPEDHLEDYLGGCIITDYKTFKESSLLPDVIVAFDRDDSDEMMPFSQVFRLACSAKTKTVLYLNHHETYGDVIESPLPLESNLMPFVTDGILPLIVENKVKNPQDALNWLLTTFLYERMKRNPSFYGVTDIQDTLSEIVESALEYLSSKNIISYDDENDEDMSVEPKIAAHIIVQYGILTDSLFHPTVITNDLADRPQLLKITDAKIDLAYAQDDLDQLLSAIDERQFIVQNLIFRSNSLLQIPHFDSETLTRCQDSQINTISSFIGIEDDDFRSYLLGFDNEDPRMLDVAEFVNRYPVVDITNVEYSNLEPVILKISIERDIEDEDDVLVVAPPISGTPHEIMQGEMWHVIVSNQDRNIIGYKPVKITRSEVQISLELTEYSDSCKVFLVCNSYLDADKEFDFHT